MLIKANNRWQAFGIHIAVSVVIFLVLASVLYFYWYPGFLFRYGGGLEGMQLIAGVDFIIGPGLTLCVYKVGKKHLGLDLLCIALVQLACLSGGMWVVWQTRPVAVVYVEGVFVTSNRLSYKADDINVEDIDALKVRWPVWLAIDLPVGSEAVIKQVWTAMGHSMQNNFNYYVAYEEKKADLKKNGLSGSEVKDVDSLLLRDFSEAHAEARYFPAATSMHSGYLAVDVHTGKALQFFERN